MTRVAPQRLRVVFFGSPAFAVPTLKALASDDTFEVVLAVTQGAKGPSPIELAAREAAIPVYRPETLRDAASRAPLVSSSADIFVVAAFGLIFRPATLAIPRLGAINIHPSLLPRYRGASPIPAAIAMGDAFTGVSLMVMNPGVDTGAVISTETASIAAEDTTESLGQRLARVAGRQAARDIPRWVNGELIAIPQPSQGESLTRTLSKGDGWLNWERPAVELERQVRAMWPWPRAWTAVEDTTLQIHRARVVTDETAHAPPGSVLPLRKRIVVACGRGALELLVVEPADRKSMSAPAYLNGRRNPLVRLGDRREVADFAPFVA